MNEMIESMKALEVDELSSAGILHAGEGQVQLDSKVCLFQQSPG